MGIHCRQIDLEERCHLRGMIEQGFSITMIAHHLGRDRRTIQRELSRNSTATGEYKPDTAPASHGHDGCVVRGASAAANCMKR